MVMTMRLLLKVQPLRPTLRKPRVDPLALGDLLGVAALQREVLCETATNNPQFTITTAPDGVGETDSLATNSTFSRTIYDRPFGKADYVESNTGDDYLTKFRQDYSWDCDTGILSQNLGAGSDPDKKQTHLNHYRMFGNGRFMQVTISNSRGRMEIANVGVKGIKGQHIGRRTI